MADQFLHGIEILEISNGPRPVSTIKSSVCMVWGTAPDADADDFPLNEPVLLLSSPRKAATLGANGTLKKAIDDIYDQDAAAVIVCRIEEGADIFETWSNILGDVTAKTGVWAALSAKAQLGLAPKLFSAPGFTSQRVEGAVTVINIDAAGADLDDSIKAYIYASDVTVGVTSAAKAGMTGDGTVTLSDPAYKHPVFPGKWKAICTAAAADGGTFKLVDPKGRVVADDLDVGSEYDGDIKFTINDGDTDYAVGDTWEITVAFTGGTGVGCTAEVTQTSGAATAIKVTRSGFNYEAEPYVAFAGGGESATIPKATATIGDAANPVVAEMLGPADRLRAIIVKDGPNSTDEDAVIDRGDWGSQRVYIVDPHVLVWDTDLDSAVSRPASARVCGLISRMDREKGYWWSPSNQTMNGVIGTARPIDFNISDPNTQANYLNENEVATIVREEGFRLWGNRTTATDPLWAFLPVRRTADMVYESIEKSFLWAMDRPLTENTILEIAESVNEYMRHLVAVGAIIGGKCWIDPELNTKTELQAGHLYVSFDIEPPAPLERLTFHAHRNGAYYEEVIERVVRELTQ